MARPPAAFETSRKLTAIIGGVVWWVILYGIGVFAVGGREVTHVPATTMAHVILIAYPFIPYFVTERVLMDGMKGVLAGKILMPEGGGGPASAVNPWWLGALNGLKLAAVPTIVGFFLAHGSTAELSARQFSVRFATAGALLAAVTAFMVAGAPLAAALRVPRGTPRSGDAKQYLWSHFVLPHGIANLVINGALAFSLSPMRFEGASTQVPELQVVIDTAATCIILTLLIASGARGQAKTEAEWGIAPRAAAAASPSVIKAFAIPLLAAIGFAIALFFVFSATHTTGIGIFSWVLYRGVVYGAYSAWVARNVAGAVIARVYNTAPSAAVPVQSSAA